MDSQTAPSVHPSYIEVLGQFSPDEARILRYFARHTSFPILRVRDEAVDGSGVGKDVLPHFNILPHDADCEHFGFAEVYIENLERLGVVNLRMDNRLAEDHQYAAIESHPLIVNMRSVLEAQGRQMVVQRGAGYVTTFGKLLVLSCVGEADFTSPLLPIYRAKDGQTNPASNS